MISTWTESRYGAQRMHWDKPGWTNGPSLLETSLQGAIVWERMMDAVNWRFNNGHLWTPSMLILFYLLGMGLFYLLLTQTRQADTWGSSVYKAPSWVTALCCHWAFWFPSPTSLSSMANWTVMIQGSSGLPFTTQLRDGGSDTGLRKVDSCKVYHVFQSPQESWEWLSDFLRASWCFSFLPSGVQQVNNFNLFLATYTENTARAQKLIHIGPKAPVFWDPSSAANKLSWAYGGKFIPSSAYGEMHVVNRAPRPVQGRVRIRHWKIMVTFQKFSRPICLIHCSQELFIQNI